MVRGKRLSLIGLAALLPMLCVLPAFGQGEAGQGEAGQGEAGQGEADKVADARGLHHEQQALRMRYLRFEETLAKMARYLQQTEPARAELIYRALARAKAQRVGERMMRTTRLLQTEEGADPQYADALAAQEEIVAELRQILTILRSEDILDANRQEQERLEQLMAKINALIDVEKIHRAQTDRGAPTDRIAGKQKKTAEKTGKLISQIKTHDAKAAGKQQDESKKSETKSADKKPGKDSESKSQPKGSGSQSKKESQKSESNQTGKDEQKKTDQSAKNGKEGSQSKSQSKNSPSQKGKPSSSKNSKNSSQGQQSQSGKSGRQSAQSTPGREQLQQARQRMQQAIQKLREKQRKQASAEQAESIQKLIEAKERIEKKLRQLREEERKLLLRTLEARFQKMHQLQQIVLNATKALHETGREQWQDRDYAQCRDAAATERAIKLEADKALKILRADGTSVAFPLAVQQIRADVIEVARLLGEENTGELTILIEEDILAALEEMIVALQKEMKELREKKNKKNSGQSGKQGKPSLVDAIAELKLLKTLQLRINHRTQAIGRLLEGEQATQPEIVNQLQELSRRQDQLHEATYDLAIGKTTR